MTRRRTAVATPEKPPTGRAPFPYFGGKSGLTGRLLALMPEHDVYVEAYSGSAALLFAKPPAALEVINDRETGLINFFRVLRDEKRAKRLRELLELTPYSREEWGECKTTWHLASDEVEMARRWFVALVQSFSKTPSHSGWSYCKQPGGHAVSKFRGLIDALPDAVARLRMVQVDCLPALECIARYDAPNVLFYIDPPYVAETRKSGGYRHEMTADDHAELLELLNGVQGMVMLSGYRSPLYDDALAGWTRTDVETVNWSSNKVREARTECIWRNPAAVNRANAGLWTREGATA